MEELKPKVSIVEVETKTNAYVYRGITLFHKDLKNDLVELHSDCLVADSD